MRGIRITTAAAATAAAVLAAGCGSQGGGAAGGSTVTVSAAAAQSPGGNGVAALGAEEIVRESAQALKDAGSARASGTLDTGDQRVALDLRLDTAGHCRGTITLDGGSGGFEVVKAGQQLWVKPDRAFWQSHGAAGLADLVGDRYLRTTADDPDFGELADLCSLNTLADQLTATGSTLRKGERTTVQGRPAVTVTGSSSSGSGTLYVAATGAPVPLRLAKDTGSVDFGEFGTPVPAQTPGPDQSVDLSGLTPSATPSLV